MISAQHANSSFGPSGLVMSWFRRKTQGVDPSIASVLERAAEHRDRLVEFGVMTDEQLSWLASQSVAGRSSLKFIEAIDALAAVLDTLSTPMTINISGSGFESTVEFDLLEPQPSTERDPARDAELEELVARANSPEVRRLDPLVDAYYAKFEDLDRHRRNGEIEELLKVASDGVELLPALVDHARAAYGRWDISSSPAVDALRRFAPIRQDRARLEEAVAVLRSRSELDGWAQKLTDAIATIELVVRICELVAAEPGTVQARLGKALGVDGGKTSLIARDLEADSQLRPRQGWEQLSAVSTGRPRRLRRWPPRYGSSTMKPIPEQGAIEGLFWSDGRVKSERHRCNCRSHAARCST